MKIKILFILPLIILGIFLFYWFQIRPSGIRNYCDQVALNKAGSVYESSEIELYDWKYTQCLHSRGLE